MAELDNPGQHGPRRPSLVLLLAGLATLTVSVGAGVGLGPDSVGFGVAGRWVVVLVALVVGGLLVLAPGRRRR